MAAAEDFLEQFDVHTYLDSYGDRGKVVRLLNIADRIPELAQSAMIDALSTVESCIWDSDLYQTVYKRARQLEMDVSIDQTKMEEQKKTVRELNTRFDNEVQKYRNLNMAEQAIEAFIQLGEHYERQGSFEAAIGKYTEARDMADSLRTSLQIRIRISRAAILGKTWTPLKSNLQLTFRDNHMSYLEKGSLMVCLGIYYLHKGHFADAATYFVTQPCSHLGDQLTDIISAQHVGLYGALCAIVAYNRSDFENKIIRNKTFQHYLGACPKAFQLVESYYDCRYADVTAALRNLEVDIMVDEYLKDHSRDILSAVRGKAMVQFFSPFSAMGMDRMAEAFGVDESELERELVTCISKGHIVAKIDAHNKVVQAVYLDEEKELFEDIQKMGTTWCRDTKAMMLRMSCLKHGVSVEAVKPNVERDTESDGLMANIMGGMGFGGRMN